MEDLLFKKICRLAGNAVTEYGMIREGDRILAGVSGGKDSVALLHVLRHFRQAAPIRFELEAVTFDPGFPGFDADATGELCQSLGIGHHVIRFDMAALLAEKQLEENPCMLCSRLRRGNLYTLARKLNFNKIALGQHLDDAEVSFLMSLCRGAGLSTMGPNVPEKSGGLRIIRPLILTPEALIAQWVRTQGLTVRGECRYKEQLENGDRRYFRELLDRLSERIPDLRSNILRSMSNIQEGYLFDHRFLDREAGL
ncbi:MAG: tRNA 2-thiocytidine biosynthesis protein TtcA [Lentisphaeria bacterium]|nr:tRNA 2-thiocytidine biosynthesis protein TtcA [Lentisphaeria bacterium]